MHPSPFAPQVRDRPQTYVPTREIAGKSEPLGLPGNWACEGKCSGLCWTVPEVVGWMLEGFEESREA